MLPSNGHCAMREEGRSVGQTQTTYAAMIYNYPSGKLPASSRISASIGFGSPRTTVVVASQQHFQPLAIPFSRDGKMNISERENGAHVIFDEGTHSSYSLFVRSASYLFICDMEIRRSRSISSSEKTTLCIKDKFREACVKLKIELCAMVT